MPPAPQPAPPAPEPADLPQHSTDEALTPADETPTTKAPTTETPADETPTTETPADETQQIPLLPNRPRSSVMRDVARLAGVSHQTVSRVLNEHPNVRPETRARVLQAMHALNYRRNVAARALVTHRSGTLGIVAFESPLFGPASMLYGIEDAARAAGYFLSVTTVRSLDRESVRDAVDHLCQQSVEGIVAITPKPSAHAALAQLPSDLPCVAVGSAGETGVPTVRIDNAAGAELATNHLLELGHRTVHHLAGPADWTEARERIDGWRDALYAAGCLVPQVVHLDWSAKAGYAHGLRLAKDPSVTAIFCANDHIALGVLRAMHEAGRRVPQDVSVVGFDDIPESAYLLPPLTTIRQDFGALGQRGLRLLLDQLRTGSCSSTDVLPATLITRASTATPPS